MGFSKTLVSDKYVSVTVSESGQGYSLRFRQVANSGRRSKGHRKRRPLPLRSRSKPNNLSTWASRSPPKSSQAQPLPSRALALVDAEIAAN